MCFTPFVLDPEAREKAGYTLVVLIGFNMIINIVIVSMDPVRKTSKRCKVRWANRHKNINKCKLCCRKLLRLPLPSEKSKKPEKPYRMETIAERSDESAACDDV